MHQHAQVPQFDGESPSLTEIWDIISPTKLCLMTKSHILRQTARTEFLPQHFYFFKNIFLNLDLCKMYWEIFKKRIQHKKWPFYHQKQLDMANYLMTISTEKQRKWTSQIFDFWNFITEIFVKHVERFSKIMKLWKIMKIANFLGKFSTKNSWIQQI